MFFDLNVIRPAHLLNFASKGVLDISRSRYGKATKQMYLLETQELFMPGVHPEYYRITSLDGQDRCRYTWRTAIQSDTCLGTDESKLFQFTKIIGPGERAVFEDVIYAADTELTPYIVSNGRLVPDS